MTAVGIQWMRNRLSIVTVAAVLPLSAGCASSVLDPAEVTGPVVVGARDGADGALLAHLYAGVLRTTGIDVQVRDGLGDRAAALRSLDTADVTVVPDYSGLLLQHYDPGVISGDGTSGDAEDVFDALARALPDELTIADYASAQNRAVLAAGTELASQQDVAGLAGRCTDLTFVVTPEFEAVGGLEALTDNGCEPLSVERADPTEAFAAASGETVAGLTTLAPVFAEEGSGSDVVTVPDVPDRAPMEEASADAETPVFVAQNVVPVFRKDVFGEPQLDALRTVAGELTTADLAEMLARIDDGDDIAAVADTWLAEHV
ncbi:glycine betaine ABC transporter substrate-binding protein [Rhodococcus artemisiae]|uniref:Glycine betaine ABC transporter substrate-binding protein n=1 Tax=Rhodococcus artemisiae TaxID=714159 RepID=A0ABU7LHY2_9NOCA|nr:glycine betaine ABC transporter substrate-binding protein [Rhodococcus artemisiae]MEE2061168.1 glycine betaine ABC transporter substrate-binding protein [Rhodococcus artemisiae]